MGFKRLGLAGGVIGALSVVTGAVAQVPAWAAAPGLQWQSPMVITSSQPFQVSSIQSCPPLPNPGDQLLIQVSVAFRGGGLNNVLPGNSDGSWSGSLTFFFTNTPRHGSISADCEDYNGVSATPYATYASAPVRLTQ
jgi:hypothetical protein